jgi:2,6-dihydroxypyridine 3-monooxygenase
MPAGEVDVFERSGVVLQGRGGGIVLHPATIRYLVERGGSATAELGRLGDLAALPRHRPAGSRIRNGRHFRFTSYDVLYRRLLASYGRDRYHLAEECLGLEDPGGQPVSGVSPRDAWPADLVVFADGINSVGRRLLAPEAEPHYAGYVAWRGTVDELHVEPRPSRRSPTRSPTTCLPAGHFITYPIRRSRARTAPAAP